MSDFSLEDAMSKHSRRQFCFGICAVAWSLAIPFSQSAATAQTPDVEHTQGIWYSTERLGGESRVTVAFRNDGAGTVGWALMLGMQRKTDDNATLGFSFCDVEWAKDRWRFKTILPDDEGTTAWEMRLTSTNTATLRPIAENGVPIDAPPVWDMIR
jgi:hypothetical protein